MSILRKQPGETVTLFIEFADLLASGDSLFAITSVTEATGAITITNKTIVGTTVSATYAGGVDGTTYHIVAIVTTTQGDTLEADVYLLVIDSPSTVMVATYYTLLERIGKWSYGIRSGYSAEQIWDIEDCIRDGLSVVYAAHDWSFLRPVTTITTTADASSYALPDGFNSIESPLTFGLGMDTSHPPVEERHDIELRRLRQRDDNTGWPLYFSIRNATFDSKVGSRKRLFLYPTPDDVYVLYGQMTLRQTRLTPVNPYPIGGDVLSQVITESCLAAAERNFDDRGNVHTEQFEKLLPMAIMMDREKSSPITLGGDAPRSEQYGMSRYDRAARMGDVILFGDPM